VTRPLPAVAEDINLSALNAIIQAARAQQHE
jgi:methyl-accepting chemotaxis protein